MRDLHKHILFWFRMERVVDKSAFPARTPADYGEAPKSSADDEKSSSSDCAC